MKKLLLALAAVLVYAGVAQASPLTYEAILTGSAELPPNGSPGFGMADVTYDPALHTLVVDVTFEDLVGTTTAAHIHCCTALPFTGTAGVATTIPTFAGFPLGVTSGSYFNSLDLTMASSYNPSFITAHGTIADAEAALALGLSNGTEYLNIHTSFAPGGEIRGFFTPVPEPATLSLLGLGLSGLLARRRMRRV